MNRISAPVRTKTREMISFSPAQGYSEKAFVYCSGRKSSPDFESAGT